MLRDGTLDLRRSDTAGPPRREELDRLGLETRPALELTSVGRTHSNPQVLDLIEVTLGVVTRRLEPENAG